ncbi:motility associated factor glycosyltransferase family protein [Domibacillus epiphyticus]|uniref:Motility accessory factor n=1 Tax=Domibacillus epiphyticus TaxID=1714355 RepID=A0A1V2A485_9BACI|nr:6-hydroxymethylpterin diphosphokinase MptE-like protein [Domibacillus epiphyticus]OMP65796.1 hypothetical protein BTO28_15570 [Domibacillus epiphyticus]
MIQIDNRNYLRIHQRHLIDQLLKWEEELHDVQSVQIESSKKGSPTLKVTVDGRQQYIHSKYDPEMEAERLISQQEDLGNYNHVLFIGIGLGYHISELLKQHPHMKFSIFEPNVEVLYQFLSIQDLKNWPIHNLETIFTGTNEETIQHTVRNIQQKGKKSTFVYTLPIYAKLYREEEKIVIEVIKELLTEKRSNLATNISFQKRWTINSIKNFPKVLQTPNILNDVDKTNFKGKPAIIVAAGPSLNEEFENLKYIKENGLAYIFSVGSAINALIEHDIYPDAVCTYDPQGLNERVIQIVKDRKVASIPLIFGSSVGFETLLNYPGGMFHMITSQDSISPLFLDRSKNIDIVLDAPSVALVTYQMLKTLGVDCIVLVGQNLSFQNNERYAKGIEYEHTSNRLTEEQQKGLITINDVYGNDIKTNDGYNRIRQQLEIYIKQSPNIKVFNTTKGGAHIEGARFKTLQELILENLKEHTVENWYVSENGYDFDFVGQSAKKIEIAKKRCEGLISTTSFELKSIEKALQNHQTKQLEKKFANFDREFKKLKNNEFYRGFIEPMIRVHNERLSEDSQSIRYEINLRKKGSLVVDVFGNFIEEIKANFQFVLPYYQELQEKIENILEKEEQK